MKTFFTFLVQLLFVNILFAQITLPVFEKQSTKGGEIKGSYVPHAGFLKNNPDFLKDGSYVFQKSEVIASEMSLDYDGYFFMDSFNNNAFPAAMATSNNKFDPQTRLLIRFVVSEPGVQFHLDKDNFIYNKFDTEYPELFDLKPEVKAAYDKNNAWYKETVNGVLKQKGAGQTVFSDLADMSFNTDSLSDKDLVLEFQYVQTNTWMQSKSADLFPSHSLYQLLVKDIEGKVLKRYGQAIFFEGSCSKFNRPKHIESFIYSNTFPQAAQSLVSQFLNDASLNATLGVQQKAIAAAQQDNKLYNKLMYYKGKINNLQSRKAQLINIGASVGVQLAIIQGGVDGVKAANQEQQRLNNLTGGNDVGNSVAGMLSNAIVSGGQKKEIARANRVNNILTTRVNKLKFEEDTLIAGLSQYIIHPSDLEKILKDRDNLNATLGNLMANTSAQSNQVSADMSNTYRELNNVYLSNIQAGLQSMAKPETAAITNTAGGQNGSAVQTGQGGSQDACTTQSKAEWQATTECKQCMAPGNRSQGICERAKAKLIEITLKNCGSKMPANEVAMLQKTRKELLDTADTLDRGAVSIH